ncbi:hypothetical protein ACKGJI_09095 [Sulfurospirillum sp. 1307]|jgi:hypothetical protein
MSLLKAAQKYLPNIFISVVQTNSNWTVYSKLIKNGTIKEKIEKTFESTNSEQIPVKMQEYLENLELEYNFSYIALFLNSLGQGAIKGVSAEDFQKNSVDIKNVTHFAIENTWSVYASFIDINWSKKLFSDIGLDFIYSPFMIIYRLIELEKAKDKPTMYILNHEDCISVAVFNGKCLDFGAFFKTSTEDSLESDEEENWEEEKEVEGVENLVELDSLGDDDIGGIEELDDLSELDELGGLDEDKVDFEDVEEEKKDLGHFELEEVDGSELELFGRDLNVYKYILNSLKEYYKNPIYDSSFIDTFVIYDGYEVSSELLDMIENELLMDVELHKINIPEIVCDMAIKEVFR